MSGLGAGSYSATLTDGSSCKAYSAVLTVNEPDQLSITDEAYTSVTGCHGDATGTLSYTATGGTGTLTYDIGSSNNTTGSFGSLTEGSYKVTVTDANSCQNTGTLLNISQPDEITVDAGDNQTICENSTVTLNTTATGTVTWSGGVSNGDDVEPTTTSTYFVSLTDASGCTATDSIVISVNPAPDVSLASDKDTVATGSSATLTASGASTYTWNKDGLSGPSVDVSPTVNTTYTVTGTDANGCQDKASFSMIVVSGDDDGGDSTSISDHQAIELNLYPNPSTGKIVVESSSNIDKAEIYKQTALVKTIAPLRGRTIDLNGLPAGIYFIRLYSGQSYTVKKISIIR